ncbi:MAG: MarR family transcriptional regulator [Lentisphaeria bacterium]|nr:MarR family transcriptional regulator [Lentisphaeria bacterium]
MNVDNFKRMYRMIDYQRRLCMCDVCGRYNWKEFAAKISFKQLDYLMLIRLAMPCNLQQVMTLTGLSCSAASLFVDKMTRQGVVLREQDPRDRRNILIRPGEKLMELLNEIDLELEKIIVNELKSCTQEQIAALEESCDLVCRKLEAINGTPVLQ